MKRLILVIVTGIVYLILNPIPALAQIEAGSSAAILMPKNDLRTEKLTKFLCSNNSPLADYSGLMIKIADKYNLDWKLIPAISGVESTFGKAIPSGSYNAYGWANGTYYFRSWEDSFEVVAKTLRENYFNKGADTVDEIAPIYAPPSNTWAWKVKFFMDKISSFTAFRTSDLELSL